MLARLEAGASVQFETVDLSALIASVRDTLGVVADSKRQQLTVHTYPKELTANGNAPLLRHAFLNIIHNAIRHSPAESRIDVRTEAQDGRAFIDIIDEGPGISRELHGRVFDRFFRADAARSRDTGGHGLGLAIARSIIEKHQGTIKILEKSGRGATFRIDLPLAAAQ
jgi:signal transduction histidine kinase